MHSCIFRHYSLEQGIAPFPVLLIKIRKGDQFVFLRAAERIRPDDSGIAGSRVGLRPDLPSSVLSGMGESSSVHTPSAIVPVSRTLFQVPLICNSFVLHHHRIRRPGRPVRKIPWVKAPGIEVRRLVELVVEQWSGGPCRSAVSWKVRPAPQNDRCGAGEAGEGVRHLALRDAPRVAETGPERCRAWDGSESSQVEAGVLPAVSGLPSSSWVTRRIRRYTVRKYVARIDSEFRGQPFPDGAWRSRTARGPLHRRRSGRSSVGRSGSRGDGSPPQPSGDAPGQWRACPAPGTVYSMTESIRRRVMAVVAGICWICGSRSSGTSPVSHGTSAPRLSCTARRAFLLSRSKGSARRRYPEPSRSTGVCVGSTSRGLSLGGPPVQLGRISIGSGTVGTHGP
jgi:hypothetical protein